MIKYLLLMLVSSIAFADITINYQIPTTNTDGSLIETIDGHNIYHWHNNASQPLVTVGGDVDTYVYNENRSGVHVFIVASVINGVVQEKTDPFQVTIPELQASKTYIITVQESP